ncbi:hypothetical protein [Brevundimonas viscosa]|uniref:Uncharacterized protein n=1 Tax=Brevundimonas viscosa TaxID=871741 RepID=A0A1I6S437_9CAUL|nr:hypothetical protein [Brevundimonas viscosa]SFS71702.1 hypothetical protein SAMN05192570_2155 [Brevundimonas viscosa]
MSRRDLPFRAVFGAPLVIGGFSLAGLVGALLDDGVWDRLGTGLLAVSLAALVWALATRRR